jgi:hypothetical protein
MESKLTRFLSVITLIAIAVVFARYAAESDPSGFLGVLAGLRCELLL